MWSRACACCPPNGDNCENYPQAVHKLQKPLFLSTDLCHGGVPQPLLLSHRRVWEGVGKRSGQLSAFHGHGEQAMKNSKWGLGAPQVAHCRCCGFQRLSNKALLTTVTELKAMAAPATMGFR